MQTPAAISKRPPVGVSVTPGAALTTVAVPSTTSRAVRDANFKASRAAVAAGRAANPRHDADMPMPAPRDEIAMSTLPRRTQRASQGTPNSRRDETSTALFPLSPAPAAAAGAEAEAQRPSQQPLTGARRRGRSTQDSSEVLIASPPPTRGPRHENPRAVAADFARTALEGPAVTAPGSTPADLWAALAPEEEPMTATQEAIPAADGFAPASPPPLFSLRSVSMDRGDETSPEPSATGERRKAPTLDDATQAKLWASSAKAYFDLIDSRPLRIGKHETKKVATVPPPAGSRSLEA